MKTSMTTLDDSQDSTDTLLDAVTGRTADGAAVYTTFASPIGALTLVSDGKHLTGIYMENHSPAPRGQGDWRPDPRPFREVTAQLKAYFAGDLGSFDLPLRWAGTSFQQKIWQALRDIPYGTTATYGELAKAIGQPAASRAVGLANGRNPISIVVPCHRVIGSSGALTGYAGGIERKRWLLRHEGVSLREDSAATQTKLL